MREKIGKVKLGFSVNMKVPRSSKKCDHVMLKMHKKGGLSIRGIPLYIFRKECEFRIRYLKITLRINFLKT
jgi:hypothetical protein